MRPQFKQQVTFLYTRDLATVAAFYEETLGLPLALDQGSCRIYQVAAGAFLGFCQREETPAEPRGVIITLVSDEVDAWYEQLQGQGVVFEKPPQRNETYHIYHCFLRDPDGNLVEIQHFLDPAWPAGG
jgi:catechol 2,3-dioxygenase-like lactoylglutathione lyase family enzyme